MVFRHINSSKITSGVTADGFNVVEQNVIRLLNVSQPQTLFPDIFQNPMEKLHSFFVEGTGSGKMLTYFRVLGRVTVALYIMVLNYVFKRAASFFCVVTLLDLLQGYNKCTY